MARQAPTFSLPNVGAGPDPFSWEDLDPDTGFLVLYFQRDFFCTNCRRQVQALGDRIAEFRKRRAEVVSIVPEPAEQLVGWQENYELPYPLLADPDAEIAAAYDQPIKFGFLGDLSDFLGRMPAVVIADRRSEPPEIAFGHRGSSTFDRPTIDEILATLDELLNQEVVREDDS